MGITIVQKSDLEQTGRRTKVALVLAGGAISGGAFKVGGLMALDRFLGQRSVTNFDIYVGISAGAFLAAPLAAGVPPIELLRAVNGRSKVISPFRPSHFYWPNVEEFIGRPLQFLRDSIAFGPAVMKGVMRGAFYNRRSVLRNIRRTLMRPKEARWNEEVLEPIFAKPFSDPQFPLSLDYLPSGLFDNKRIESYIRTNLERNGLPNHFRLLRLEHGASLYIGATNLENATFDVFGPDEDHSITISQAVQASTAIPVFFRPARLHGRRYIDGAISKTASMSVAAAKGADLIIAYNPFRPYVSRARKPGQEPKNIGDSSALTVLNQAFRTLLHTRLHLGMEKLRLDPEFKGDIILIEPSASDEDFFQMNPLNFWTRHIAAAHGFRSVKESIESQYPSLKRILEAHGFNADLSALQSTFDRIAAAEEEKQVYEALEADARKQNATAKPHLKVV